MDRIYPWNKGQSPRISSLISKMTDVGILPDIYPENRKLIDDIINSFDVSLDTSQWAIFSTNDPVLLNEVEHSVLTTICLTYGLSVNLLSPQILFDNLRQHGPDEPHRNDIFAGGFVVLSEIDKPLKALEYHKGTLVSLFKHWIKSKTMVLATTTYRETFSEKQRMFLDTINYYYGEVAHNVFRERAIYLTHQAETRKSIKMRRVG